MCMNIRCRHAKAGIFKKQERSAGPDSGAGPKSALGLILRGEAFFVCMQAPTILAQVFIAIVSCMHLEVC